MTTEFETRVIGEYADGRGHVIIQRGTCTLCGRDCTTISADASGGIFESASLCLDCVRNAMTAFENISRRQHRPTLFGRYTDGKTTVIVRATGPDVVVCENEMIFTLNDFNGRFHAQPSGL